MRLVWFFILLFINILLKAQPVRVGLVIQPGISYYTVQADLAALSQNFRQQIKPVFTYNGGVILLKELSSGVSFVSGVMLSQKGIRSQFNTSNITAFNFSTNGYDLKLIDRYLEIPLLLNVYFRKTSKFSAFGSFGLKPALYINSVSKMVGSSENYSPFYYNGHRKLNLFASIGLGAEMAVNKRFNFFVWPAIDHALLSETYASPLKLYPYSLGINLSLIYSLGN